MKTSWTNILIGLAVLLGAVYVLKPSLIVRRNEGFADVDVGGIVGIVVFVVFLCFAFGAIAMSK
jgi:hypothetical protein